MSQHVYLDHAAMSPVHPRVLDAMQPWLGDAFGNPSAQYAKGRLAAAAVEEARQVTAGVLNCRTAEVVFTSGGSESINAGIKGIAFAQHFARLGSHLVVSAVEHHAVIHTCQYLEKFGFETTYVGVDRYGVVDPDDVARAIRPDTVLVSVMLANNEVGTIQPLAELSRAVRSAPATRGRPVPIHTDAVQAPLWLDVDVQRLGVDALSLSAHKFGGPSGAGVLFLRRGIPFLAQQTGGGQERQRRAGTENVAAIAGAGVAIELARSGISAARSSAERLRTLLGDRILATVPGASVNGHPSARLPNILNVSFPGVEGERLVAEMDALGVDLSSGSACASQSWEPSHVLLAMGLSLEAAVGALRLSLGPDTTEFDVETAIELLPEALRAVSPLPVG